MLSGTLEEGNDNDDASTSERGELLSVPTSNNDPSIDVTDLHESTKYSIEPHKCCCSIKNGLLLIKRRPVVTVCVITFMISIVIFNLMTVVEYDTKSISEKGTVTSEVAEVEAERKYHDLKNYTISQLCHTEDDDSCRCDDPLKPLALIRKSTKRGWRRIKKRARKRNKNLIAQSMINETNRVDVVFLGNSITAEWYGNGTDERSRVFEELFQKNSGGKYEGIALGIPGNKAPELLWRIQNGEMPKDLNPKVWWVLIGTNDLSSGCSVEATIVGILRVVLEIQEEKPTSTIVINGILPSSNEENWKLTDTLGKWPLIVKVNDELSKYCQTKKNVEYFDASDIFIKEGDDNDDKYIMKGLMKDNVHPTALGHKLWGEAIVKWLDGHLVRDSS